MDLLALSVQIQNWRDQMNSLTQASTRLEAQVKSLAADNNTLRERNRTVLEEQERIQRANTELRNEIVTLTNSEHWVSKALFEEAKKDAEHWKKLHDAMHSRAMRAEADLTNARQAVFDFEQSNKKMRETLARVAVALRPDDERK